MQPSFSRQAVDLNHTEAFVEVEIDGYFGAGTINLTMTNNLVSANQTGFLGANQTGFLGANQGSAVPTLGSALPLTQMPSFVNSSAVHVSTAYMPSGFGANVTPTLLPMTMTATTLSNFTGPPGPAASGGLDGPVSLLAVIFRAIFGGS